VDKLITAKKISHSSRILRYADKLGGEREAWRKVLSFWVEEGQEKEG